MRVLILRLCLILAETVLLSLYFQVVKSKTLFCLKMCCLIHMFIVFRLGAYYLVSVGLAKVSFGKKWKFFIGII